MKNGQIKGIAIGAAAVCLLGGGIYAGVRYMRKNSSSSVEVTSVAAQNMAEYISWGDSDASSGTIVSDVNQEVTVPDDKVIDQVYVSEGDEVKIGDKLLSYDTTLLELDKELQEITVMELQLELKAAQADLQKLKNTTPVEKSSSDEEDSLNDSAGTSLLDMDFSLPSQSDDDDDDEIAEALSNNQTLRTASEDPTVAASEETTTTQAETQPQTEAQTQTETQTEAPAQTETQAQTQETASDNSNSNGTSGVDDGTISLNDQTQSNASTDDEDGNSDTDNTTDQTKTAADVTNEMTQLRINVGNAWYQNAAKEKVSLEETEGGVSYAAIDEDTLQADTLTAGFQVLYRILENGDARTIYGKDYVEIKLPQWMQNVRLTDQDQKIRSGEVEFDGATYKIEKKTDETYYRLKITFQKSIDEETDVSGTVGITFDLDKTALTKETIQETVTLQKKDENENKAIFLLPADPQGGIETEPTIETDEAAPIASADETEAATTEEETETEDITEAYDPNQMVENITVNVIWNYSLTDDAEADRPKELTFNGISNEDVPQIAQIFPITMNSDNVTEEGYVIGGVTRQNWATTVNIAEKLGTASYIRFWQLRDAVSMLVDGNAASPKYYTSDWNGTTLTNWTYDADTKTAILQVTFHYNADSTNLLQPIERLKGKNGSITWNNLINGTRESGGAYKGTGTADDPFVFFVTDGVRIDNTFMNWVQGLDEKGNRLTLFELAKYLQNSGNSLEGNAQILLNTYPDLFEQEVQESESETETESASESESETESVLKTYVCKGFYVRLEIRDENTFTEPFVRTLVLDGTKSKTHFGKRIYWIFSSENGLTRYETEKNSGGDGGDGGYDGDGDIDGIDSGETTYTAEELAEVIKEKEREIRKLNLDAREAELKLKEYNKDIEDSTVVSAVNGYVKSVGSAEQGEPYMVVSNEGGLYLKTTVSELDLDSVAKGDTVNVTSWESGSVFAATITSISYYPSSTSITDSYGTANTNASSYPVLAHIEDTTGLSADEMVNVQFPDSSSSTGDIYLSKAYIRSENGQSYVYKRGSNGKLTKQYIHTGEINQGYAEVKDGLSTEDYIAFPYGKTVKEGAKTTISEEVYYG